MMDGGRIESFLDVGHYSLSLMSKTFVETVSTKWKFSHGEWESFLFFVAAEAY